MVFLVLVFLMLVPSASLTKTALILPPVHAGSPPDREGDVVGKLSRGKFLVASVNLRDPRFRETVILLIRYDQNGAMGVIINRPTELSLSDATSGEAPFNKRKDDVVFFGGPVESDRMLLLIRSQNKPEESVPVFKGVYASGSMVVLTRMIERPRSGEKFQLYAGYSGWASGQLEGEITRGDWNVVQADPKVIFEMKPEKIWSEMIRRSSAIEVKNSRTVPYPSGPTSDPFPAESEDRIRHSRFFSNSFYPRLDLALFFRPTYE